MKVDYVDIFYSHRQTRQTPIEETIGRALEHAVRCGKRSMRDYQLRLRRKPRRPQCTPPAGTPCSSISQNIPCSREISRVALLDVLERKARLHRLLPASRRACSRIAISTHPKRFARQQASRLPEEKRCQRAAPGAGARAQRTGESRGQSSRKLALAWVLRDARMTSASIGASRVEQVDKNVGSAQSIPL